MVDPLEEFSRLSNFQQITKVLAPLAAGSSLQWLEQPPKQVCKAWYDLGNIHLSEARKLLAGPGSWRTVVSRSYYCVYNVSKAIRYYVSGSCRRDVDDHKHVGDLPGDFPDRDLWSNLATELRRDRNIADYEPWTAARSGLSYQPLESVAKAEEFLQVSRKYLVQRGVAL